MSSHLKYFKATEIDEFRECFYLFAKNRESGYITTLDELTVIMRSLGMSPTIKEITAYMKKKNNKMSFSDFLDTVHFHSGVEKLPKEIMDAFEAADVEKSGKINARVLKNILGNWGERLSSREIDNIFREANVSELITYSDFVKICAAPVPDYY
ncbi:unnamed protein product [Diamesa serratosioi]